MFARSLPGRLEARQADEGHGGGDGQGPDVLEQESGEPQAPDAHLDQGRHDDGPLDLRGEEDGSMRFPEPTLNPTEAHLFSITLSLNCIWKQLNLIEEGLLLA